MKRISDGAAVDPETSRRIEERADRITARSAAPAASWTTTNVAWGSSVHPVFDAHLGHLLKIAEIA